MVSNDIRGVTYPLRARRTTVHAFVVVVRLLDLEELSRFPVSVYSTSSDPKMNAVSSLWPLPVHPPSSIEQGMCLRTLLRVSGSTSHILLIVKRIGRCATLKNPVERVSWNEIHTVVLRFSRECRAFEGHVGNVAKLVLRALHDLTGARIIRLESQVTFGLL
jgi:hypothetical protein